MSKPGILTWIDENWEDIECQFYGSIQQGAFSAALTSAFTGKFPLSLGLAGISYAASKTAEMAGCNYEEPQLDNPPAIGGCKQIAQTPWTKNNYGQLYINRTDYEEPGAPIGVYVVSIDRIEDFNPPAGPSWKIFWTYINNAEFSIAGDEPPTYAEGSYWFYKDSLRYPIATLIPVEGSTCEIPAPDGGPGPHEPDEPICDPIVHTDFDCNWTIQATDAYVDDQGVFHTYYTITADNDACGGPFAYWSSGSGPQYVCPYPPVPPNPPNPPVPPPDWNPRFDDIDDTLDEIEEKLDQLKECACPEITPIEGQFRTISFRSDETSPFGKSRLRKRLRYRGSEGVELSALVDHWRDFSWQSGPVRVRHTGARWGNPEVWAASEAEGKRVLFHAAREAGIDPNQVGRWSARSSDSSRLGVSDTMRVDTTGGYYWITARDGSDERPLVQAL